MYVSPSRSLAYCIFLQATCAQCATEYVVARLRSFLRVRSCPQALVCALLHSTARRICVQV